MKKKLMAITLTCSVAGLAGCADLQQQMVGTQQPVQPAPQQASVSSGQEQQPASQQQESNGFLGEILKTATETLTTETKNAVQSGIRDAVRN